jgi:hypothetical protein
MWKDSNPMEPLKGISQGTTPPSITQPITEDEFRGIMERLDATREVFRQIGEVRELLSRREIENRTLQSRNAELEEMMRKFAPMLLNVATTMGLAAKNDKPTARNQL